MATHRIPTQFRTVVQPDGSTVGKCRKTNAHPRITMRMLCGKVGQKSGNRPVKF